MDFSDQMKTSQQKPKHGTGILQNSEEDIEEHDAGTHRLQIITSEHLLKSRELVKVFLSQPLTSHDPATISQYLFDIINFVNKDHFDCSVFCDEDEQNFCLKPYQSIQVFFFLLLL